MKLLNYYNLKRFVLFLIILISNNVVYSQTDSKKSATTASILSMACPGLGQIYNKKYWKAPIIYAGLGGTIYYYYHNNAKYNQYKSAYIAETDDDETTSNNSGYTTSNLITLQDYYRNSRDLFGLLFLLVYLLNIVDASVDAHLIDYNINDNLSLNLKPNYINNQFETINVSLRFNL